MKLNRDRQMRVSVPWDREGMAVMSIENEEMAPQVVIVAVTRLGGETLIESKEEMAARDDGRFTIGVWWLDGFEFGWLRGGVMEVGGDPK